MQSYFKNKYVLLILTLLLIIAASFIFLLTSRKIQLPSFISIPSLIPRPNTTNINGYKINIINENPAYHIVLYSQETLEKALKQLDPQLASMEVNEINIYFTPYPAEGSVTESWGTENGESITYGAAYGVKNESQLNIYIFQDRQILDYYNWTLISQRDHLHYLTYKAILSAYISDKKFTNLSDAISNEPETKAKHILEELSGESVIFLVQ